MGDLISGVAGTQGKKRGLGQISLRLALFSNKSGLLRAILIPGIRIISKKKWLISLKIFPYCTSLNRFIGTGSPH